MQEFFRELLIYVLFYEGCVFLLWVERAWLQVTQNFVIALHIVTNVRN